MATPGAALYVTLLHELGKESGGYEIGGRTVFHSEGTHPDDGGLRASRAERRRLPIRHRARAVFSLLRMIFFWIKDESLADLDNLPDPDIPGC